MSLSVCCADSFYYYWYWQLHDKSTEVMISNMILELWNEKQILQASIKRQIIVKKDFSFKYQIVIIYGWWNKGSIAVFHESAYRHKGHLVKSMEYWKFL